MGALKDTRVLLLGATGMLGAETEPLLLEAGAEVFCASSKDRGGDFLFADFNDLRAVGAVIAEVRPAWIVNCAGYTAVDAAESDYAEAFALNASAPAALARAAAAAAGCRLLHISTDYIFGGDGQRDRNTPFREDDAAAPCGIYGHSKYYGEQLVSALLPDRHLVLRTSWLHGVCGKNFLETMLRLGRERDELSVVDDQVGSPTWAGWLAEMIVKLLEVDARGVYHASSRGGVSWYDFAEEIFRQSEVQVKLSRQSTAGLGRPAPRPPYSVLDVGKLERLLKEPAIDWKQGVAAHLAACAK